MEHLAGRYGGTLNSANDSADRLCASIRGRLSTAHLAPGGACGGVEAPNWNACNPRCGNAMLDATQLAFLKDTADRIRSYLDDMRIGTTLRLLLQDQLDDLTIAIADHESRPAPTYNRAQP